MMPPRHHFVSSEDEVYCIMSSFGRDTPSRKEVEWVDESLSCGHYDFVLALSAEQQLLAAEDFDFDGDLLAKTNLYDSSVGVALLEPLLWDSFTGDNLILYHPEDKSFWAWSGHKDIAMESRLVKLGYRWTDVFLINPGFPM
jgi:hypothetical protein